MDGDRVYVHFGASGTAALSTDGDVLWTTRFPYISQHGNGGSPTLYKDLLIINCDGYDQAFVVALETATGEVRWKADRSGPFSQAYSTPLVIRVGERDQAISIGAFRTTAFDAETVRRSGTSGTRTASRTSRDLCTATVSSTSIRVSTSRR